MLKLLARMFAVKTAAAPRQEARLRVERLEGRDCPAVVGGGLSYATRGWVPVTTPGPSAEQVAAREAARRSACSNQLKQIGLIFTPAAPAKDAAVGTLIPAQTLISLTKR